MFLLTKNLKKVGANTCLSQLIKIFSKLETVGLEIKTENTTERIFFSLGLIIGENKGLNEIMLFAKSFSHNFFCRLCVADKNQTKNMIAEKENLLRNRQNHKDHISENKYK